ncbi:MAG: hypothetical protein ACKV0T_26275 [Planctomycetales bacterium]
MPALRPHPSTTRHDPAPGTGRPFHIRLPALTDERPAAAPRPESVRGEPRGRKVLERILERLPPRDRRGRRKHRWRSALWLAPLALTIGSGWMLLQGWNRVDESSSALNGSDLSLLEVDVGEPGWDESELTAELADRHSERVSSAEDFPAWNDRGAVESATYQTEQTTTPRSVWLDGSIIPE